MTLNKFQRKPSKYSRPVVLQDVFVSSNAPQRVDHKRIRFSLHRSQEKDKPRSALDAIKDFATIFGGLTGILLAITWMGGRFYAAGYFYFMNIPLSQMIFSIWEYGENYFLVILMSFFIYFQNIMLYVAEVVLLSIIISLILVGIKKIVPTLKLREAIENLLSKKLMSVVFAISAILTLILSFGLAFNFGVRSAFDTIAKGSQKVTIYSKEFRPIGDYSKIAVPGQTESSYQFTGLRFLTYNNNKYYLFDEVDVNTCKPIHVYVIDDTENLGIVFNEVTPIDPCASKAQPSLLP